LSRPDAAQPDADPNLKAILTRPIDWELIRQQYDHMVKYVTAVRLGTAETESIPRHYGMLPPRFFAHVRDRILQAHLRRKLTHVGRSD
jgi:hypothetical protein